MRESPPQKPIRRSLSFRRQIHRHKTNRNRLVPPTPTIIFNPPDPGVQDDGDEQQVWIDGTFGWPLEQPVSHEERFIGFRAQAVPVASSGHPHGQRLARGEHVKSVLRIELS